MRMLYLSLFYNEIAHVYVIENKRPVYLEIPQVLQLNKNDLGHYKVKGIPYLLYYCPLLINLEVRTTNLGY